MEVLPYANNQKISTGISHAQIIISELVRVKNLKPNAEIVRLAGTAALLHNFYNGVENILKVILKDKKIQIPQSPSWHKELLNSALSNKIISEQLMLDLDSYRSFRHLFIHTYAFDIDDQKMAPLMKDINKTFKNFKKEIQAII